MKTLRFQSKNYLHVYDDGSYDIVLGRGGVFRCRPSVDHVPLGDARVSFAEQDDAVTVRYHADAFTLELGFRIAEGRLTIRPRLTELALDRVEKVCIFDRAAVIGGEKVLAHGYFSWDQSFLLDAGAFDQAEGSAVTAILNETEVVILGYLVHDRMFQTWKYASCRGRISLTSEMYLEGKDLAGCRDLAFSPIVVFTAPDLDRGQSQWADLVADANEIRLTKPRTVGWCSWYYDYFWFSGDILESHLKDFASFKEELGLKVFVIDANHFSALGDWLDPDPKFAKGLQHYARAMAGAGYVPGVWIGPWMVADRSRLFREHPEWLCRDQDGDLIEFMNPLGEDNVWGYRSKIHYCLDTSHPEAFAYLREVFRTLRAWGFTYFKTDFMFWGSMDRFEGGWYHEGLNAHNLIADKAQRPLIRRHTPGKTRMEYFIDVLKMIREEIGEESIWLGCGQPIWASIGYVDCMRVSRDVGARWVAHNSPKELLNDLALRNFTNGRFYEVDPDCVLLRDWETKITETEATSLALYMGVAQGMILTSDYVHQCKPHRLDLFAFLQGDNGQVSFRPPLLGREEQVIIYTGTRKDNGLGIIFAFNHGEERVQKTFRLPDLEITGRHAVDWRGGGAMELHGEISLDLEPHASTLVYVKDTPFDPGWKPAKITG